MSATPPATLIDVIVLCFTKSELKSVVGTDALRSVLEGSKRALFPEPDQMVLQSLYDLLEEQPGFEEDKAVAPFCRLKGWESQLKVKIELPAKLQGLDRDTRDRMSLGCNASDGELEKLLKPATTASIPITRHLETTKMGALDRPSGNKKAKIAMVAAVLGVVAAIISIYLTMRGGSGRVLRLSPKDISEQIPFSDVRKSGQIILATISDPKWMQKPEVERRLQLEGTASKIRAQGAIKMLVQDSKGIPIGSVLVRKDPVVTFTPLPH